MKINYKKLAIITLITFLIGNLFLPFVSSSMEVFKVLRKPIDIPGWVFPVVWTILYLLMSISCYLIYETNDINKKSAIISYWAQLVINSLWTLIFFGFKMYLFGFIWIVLLIIAVIIMMAKFFNIKKASCYLNIPYLIWLFIACYLNFGIYIMNK